jgi:hypothetical protein
VAPEVAATNKDKFWRHGTAAKFMYKKMYAGSDFWIARILYQIISCFLPIFSAFQKNNVKKFVTCRPPVRLMFKTK